MDNKENIILRGVGFPAGLAFMILGVPMIFDGGFIMPIFGWTFPYFVFMMGVMMCWISWNVNLLDEID